MEQKGDDGSNGHSPKSFWLDQNEPIVPGKFLLLVNVTLISEQLMSRIP